MVKAVRLELMLEPYWIQDNSQFGVKFQKDKFKANVEWGAVEPGVDGNENSPKKTGTGWRHILGILHNNSGDIPSLVRQIPQQLIMALQMTSLTTIMDTQTFWWCRYWKQKDFRFNIM